MFRITPSEGATSPYQRLALLLVILTFSSAATAAQFPWMEDEPSSPGAFLTALLAQQQKDGRDNALIHYERAAQFFPGDDDKLSTDISNVLKNGWKDNATSQLEAYLAAAKPMLDEMRAGAALDHVKPIPQHGVSTPVPNTLALMTSAKLLCAEGRRFESDGKYADAIHEYLTVLTISRDLMLPGQSLIAYLVGIADTRLALRQLARTVQSGRLSRADLEQLASRLATTSNTLGIPLEAMRVQYRIGEFELNRLKRDEDRVVELLKWEPFTGKKTHYTRSQALKAFRNAVNLEQQYWDYVFETMRKPFWQWNTIEIDRKFESFVPKARIERFVTAMFIPPSFVEIEIRFLVAKSQLLQTAIMTALASHKLDHGSYPEKLADLVPAYVPAIPLDPFTGKAFEYPLDRSGQTYTLRGAGPTRKIPATHLLYDPTNGIVSSGQVGDEASAAR